ncbi:hypothetical protein NDA11_004289 [Ustilago hordei]|nr:hypothetical protein NDA10_004202 [Ustilago hordei]KAJ1586371.1 hypothetical protein NDA12_007354 [Ustilago hordei]KAJ1590941.1 hypothetical protein NDA11_004289 [Ustilago hordei]UTT93148.1 hypothetical protein NDA17_001752 [Ustilago hordei]
MLRTLASPAVTRGILSSARTSTRTFASSSTTFSSDKPSSSPPTTPTPITPTTPSSPPSESSASTSSKPLVRESFSSPEELNSRPLPYLSFPLGLPTPPSSSKPTWSETRDRLISPEYRMASRKAIVKEATRGYFHDFHAIRSHGGKTWRAPNTLIKDERALWFPRIEGTRLSDKGKVNTVDMLRGKVSLVALLGSKISEEHTKSFYESTVATFGSHPRFQLVMINLQSNPLKSYLISLFTSSLRQKIPPALHPTYLLSSQNVELEKEAIGFHNKHVGYTYLVDAQGRIRWAGGGFAEEAEARALRGCTGVLLERTVEELKQRAGGKK